MDDNTRKMILTAWREDRLAAVHIHLQKMCYEPATARAFENSALAADFFRAQAIENIWAVAPHHRDRKGMKEQTTSVSAFNGACKEDRNKLHVVVGADADETVVIRKSYSAFREGYLDKPTIEKHLKDSGKDTILLTGVYADQCFQYSMEMAFHYTPFNIVALTDCTNEPREGYIAERLSRHPFHNNTRLRTATFEDLERTLPSLYPARHYG